MEDNKIYTIEQFKEFSNNIVKHHFNDKDLKLLKLIIANTKGGCENYLFDLNQLQNLGFETQTCDQELFESLEKLSNYFVNIQNGFGDMHRMGIISNKFTIDKETNILSISLHKELVPFLQTLKNESKTIELAI
ncbi:MAG: hypothetical protein IE909_13095 [Campylobacterales bacterium]|nr:hypothetical protein [Campylobacterales bacterium]